MVYRLSPYDEFYGRRIIVGHLFTASSDVDLFRREGAKKRLQLNVGKCEVISKAPFKPEGSFAGFCTLFPSDAILIGASLIGLGSATDRTLEARCSDLRMAITRLKSICAHDALILLRSSFSSNRLLYTFRSTPCNGHSLLGTYDDLITEGISAICNSHLGDLQWIQASLSILGGGLGIRRAFLADHFRPFGL